ncbi:MAG TPA: hypothetical protein VF741_04680 [Candidatus Aquilonibacter sp.]
MNLPAIRTTDILPAVATPSVAVTPPTAVLDAPHATSAFSGSHYGFVGSAGNLSEAAKPVFEALQSAAAFPPSTNATYVLPINGNFLRLFSAVQAVAAERVYPAPVFSFTA